MKTYLNKIKQNPWHIFLSLASRNLLDWLPDKQYLELMYRGSTGKKLNLKDPKSYNEKIQWLKLNDRKSYYTKLVDKYEVKKWVKEKIGKEYVIPTYGVWDSFDDIDFSKLPNQFVLKCTHDSGGLVIVKDKTQLEYEKARTKIEKCLNYNFYKYGREWPYKNVKPRIIAEQYMEDIVTGELRDYKYFAFNGECKAMFIATERQSLNSETRFDFFDMEGKYLPIVNIHPNADTPPQLPVNFELMKELACKLSMGLSQIRVDFYEVNGKVYFGELTFAHGTGFEPFYPDSWDYTFGSWIDLSIILESKN
ncbi:MAG: ATP-grasp fold amidoligase family protein [Anaerostipes sp.]|nr:ATP-grasp fold amidoligase family protein [Anaerostipes sp.]